MGLFDAFGVGGGSLSLQIQFNRVQAGGVVQGQAVFQGGRRAQQVTNVTVRVNQTLQTPQPSGQLMQQTRELVPTMTVSGPFTAQSGQTYAFPFQFQVPPDAWATTPNMASYRIVGNVDIDGEIDPGAGVDLHVDGAPYPVHAPMAPMGKPQPGYPATGYDAGHGKFDPNTGKTFDPHTGKVIDPHTGKGWDPNGGKGHGKY